MAPVLGNARADLTDELALAAVAHGDPDALVLLVQRHAQTARGAARRLIGDDGDADDVTQELFVRVWIHAAAFDPARGRAAPWLLTIARNLARNEARRRRRAAAPFSYWQPDDAPAERVPDPHADVEAESCAAEQRRLVASALGTLPPTQRAVIEHAFFGGLSQSQIAAALGIPLGTVKSRMSGALRRLRATPSLRGLAPVRRSA